MSPERCRWNGDEDLRPPGHRWPPDRGEKHQGAPGRHSRLRPEVGAPPDRRKIQQRDPGRPSPWWTSHRGVEVVAGETVWPFTAGLDSGLKKSSQWINTTRCAPRSGTVSFSTARQWSAAATLVGSTPGRRPRRAYKPMHWERSRAALDQAADRLTGGGPVSTTPPQR